MNKAEKPVIPVLLGEAAEAGAGNPIRVWCPYCAKHHYHGTGRTGTYVPIASKARLRRRGISSSRLPRIREKQKQPPVGYAARGILSLYPNLRS